MIDYLPPLMFVGSTVLLGTSFLWDSYRDNFFLQEEKNQSDTDKDTSKVDNGLFSSESLLSSNYEASVVKDTVLLKSVDKISDTPLNAIIELLQAIDRSDFEVFFGLDYSLLKHASIQADIWVFHQYKDKFHFIITHKNSDIMNFFWNEQGEFEFLEDTPYLRSDAIHTDFCNTFTHTIRPQIKQLTIKDPKNDLVAISLDTTGETSGKVDMDTKEFDSPPKTDPLRQTPKSLAADNEQLRNLFQSIALYYREIQPHLVSLSVEEQHEVERIIEGTYPNLVFAYCQLDKEQQTDQMSAFLKGLQNIQEQLTHTLDNLKQSRIREFDKRVKMTIPYSNC